MRARVEANISVGATIGDTRLWAVRIVHSVARKTPKYLPKRAHLIARMVKMAEIAEKTSAGATPKANLDSPAPAVRIERQETAVLAQLQRSVFGSELVGAVVDSPTAPMRPLE